MTALFSRITERPHVVSTSLWLVAAEWRGGHDKRVIRLQSIFGSEADAIAAWNALTPENHNIKHGKPVDYDSGFVRLPLRRFDEDTQP